MEEQSPRSEAAAERLAETIAGNNPPDATVAILIRSGEGAEKFSGNLETALTNAGLTVTTNVIGNPTAARAVLESQAAPLAAIAADEHMIVFCNELLPKLAGNIRTSPRPPRINPSNTNGRISSNGTTCSTCSNKFPSSPSSPLA